MFNCFFFVLLGIPRLKTMTIQNTCLVNFDSKIIFLTLETIFCYYESIQYSKKRIQNIRELSYITVLVKQTSNNFISEFVFN